MAPVFVHPQNRPQRSSTRGTTSRKPFTPAELAKLALNEKKGADVVVIPLAGKSTMADHLVIATGTSTTHVVALADAVSDTLNRSGTPVLAVEGLDDARWVVVDAGDVIVHIFLPEARVMYQLEKMWSLSFNDTADNDDDAAA